MTSDNCILSGVTDPDCDNAQTDATPSNPCARCVHTSPSSDVNIAPPLIPAMLPDAIHRSPLCVSPVGNRPPKLSCAFVHAPRSEEHTSELQSRENLVCRLLLEKKKRT